MSAHLILIDALNLIRRIYAVQERPFIQVKNQGAGELSVTTQQQVLFNTQNACTAALEKIITQHQPTHGLAIFDSQQPCWRYKLYSDYKKGRKKMPQVLADKLTSIQDSFMSLQVDSLTSEEDEADDLIATLATKMALHGHNATIISTDKIFLSLLGPHIKVYDHFNRRYFDEEYVKSKFNIKSSQLVDFLTLTGDSTNKIPGVEGIGQVTAAHLLKQHSSLKALCSATDIKKSLREKLTNNSEKIALSRTLITLKKDIPLGFNLKDIRLTNTVTDVKTIV